MSKATERRLNKVAAKQTNQKIKVFYARGNDIYSDDPCGGLTFTRAEVDAIADGCTLLLVKYGKPGTDHETEDTTAT